MRSPIQHFVFLLLLTLFLFSLPLSVYAQDDEACNNSSGETVTLEAPSYTQSAVDSVIGGFASHCGFTLTPLYDQTSDVARLVAEAQAGSAPALAILPNATTFTTIASGNYLIPLDSLGISAANYNSNWFGFGSYYTGEDDNTLWYGLPVDGYIASTLVWYNIDLFKKWDLPVPTTFQKFLDIVSQINGIIADNYQAVDNFKPISINQFRLTSFYADLLIRYQGQSALDTLASPEGTWQSDSMISALKQYQDFAQNNVHIFSSDQSPHDLQAPFLDTPTAFMTIADGSAYSTIEQVTGSGTFGSRYGFFVLPTDNNAQSGTQASVNLITAFQQKDNSNQNAVTAILKYITTSQGATEWAKARSTLSPNTGVELSTYADNAALQQEQKTFGTPPDLELNYALPELWAASSDADNALFALATGQTDATAAADTIEKTYDRSCYKSVRTPLGFVRSCYNC